MRKRVVFGWSGFSNLVLTSDEFNKLMLIQQSSSAVFINCRNGILIHFRPLPRKITDVEMLIEYEFLKSV